MALTTRPARLGDLLIARQRLSADQLNIALAEQKRQPEPLGQVLLRLGFVSEPVLLDTLGEALGVVTAGLGGLRPAPAALACLPAALARRFGVLPLTLDLEARSLSLAMTDTGNVVALDQCAAHLPPGIHITPVLVGAAELAAGLDDAYGAVSSVTAVLADHEPTGAAGPGASSPIVRLLDAVLAEAVRRGASDIHCEPEAGYLRLRFRIDGILREAHCLHRDYWPALAVRLKVLAGLDIAESRAPQDGRFSLQLGGRPVDFRVSSLPTTYGENIVLRVLDRQRGIVPLTALGLDEASLRSLRLMVARPAGLLLVCGPTGSGKTTTLYSLINHLNTPEVNVMTLEDPVEYPLASVRQTSLSEGLRLDFASGVRALMRQDPDILLIGEIRDEDTAAMAVRAAMTGHQVFSTLHANSALGALGRLTEMGVRPALLAGNLSGLVSQRLVRRLRPEAVEWDSPRPVERELLGLAADDPRKLPRLAAALRSNPQAAYAGRAALMEVLRVDRRLDELIARAADMGALRQAAAGAGFLSLAEVAVARVLEGMTTLEEVSRVIDLTERLGPTGERL